MTPADTHSWRTPRESDLGLARVGNNRGLGISALPGGSLFAIEHRSGDGSILVNQVLASPLDGGIGRIVLRVGGQHPVNIEVVGAGARVELGVAADRMRWEGTTGELRHRVTLHVLPNETAWLWHVEVTNAGAIALPLDAILVQDLGLGVRGFVTNNEAYASQYIDQRVARHARFGRVVMSRQNLAQDGRHPWVMHGCLDGGNACATDAMQVFGPRHRDADRFDIPFGTPLADRCLQHEVSCVAIQSPVITLRRGASGSWRFFGLYEPDHPGASSDDDLARLDALAWPGRDEPSLPTTAVRRSLVADALAANVVPFSADTLARHYPDRVLEESDADRPLSFFTPDPPHNRHVVLHAKEHVVVRRHGAILRSGGSWLPDETTLSATCWMHGVFAAQLTIGNTSFHKLFSVSRDPYNITRASGLRVLAGTKGGWRSLTIPSAFEMGLSDCRWIYVLADRVISVRAIAAGDDPAMQWRITVVGAPCRFLVFGQLVLGEREFEHAGIVDCNTTKRRFTFRPDPDSLWGRCYSSAAYHLVTSTPHAIDTLGGDELLYAD
ncbi:MAG TPA: cellobiose phosphorylase, partial [Casimicrobiaceae bacterium]|nr:cellobiose phosphorylase [Casimicrobiaceae bacterium]